MDAFHVAEVIAKSLFGVFSLAAIGWLIRILTDINKNQKEQIQILRDQFAERERTRDQHIAFLETQHQKETAFLERHRDSLVQQIEAEKHVLEQRMLLIEQKSRAPVTDSRTTEPEVTTPDEEPRMELAEPEKRRHDELRDLSLMFSHTIRNYLGALASHLKDMPKDPDSQQKLQRVRVVIRRINETSHALGAVSDEGVRRIEQVTVDEVLRRAVERFDSGELKITVEESIRALPTIETDPLILEMIFTELLRNAAFHASKSEVFINGASSAGTVSIRIINEVTRGVRPEELTGFFEGQVLSNTFGYGLHMVKHLTETLAGRSGALIENGDVTNFIMEIKLPIIMKDRGKPNEGMHTDVGRRAPSHAGDA